MSTCAPHAPCGSTDAIGGSVAGLTGTGLVLQNNSRASFDLPGLAVAPHTSNIDISKFDLTVSFAETRGSDGAPQGIYCALEYATDLFDRETVGRLGERLIRLFEAVVVDPRQAVGRIDLLDAEEHRTILTDWNAPAHPVSEATLPELFEAQVARTPDATALLFESLRQRS